MREPAGIERTDHVSEAFEVQTTDSQHRFEIATDYIIGEIEDGYPFLTVFGDDDFEDGPIQLRTFNMDYVIDYGWSK